MAAGTRVDGPLGDDPIELVFPGPVGLRKHIAYAIAGPENGPVVTVIPGGSGAVRASALTTVWRALSTEYRTVIVETRGAPLVGHDRLGFSTRDIAADVVALLDHLEIPQTRIIGASLGSLIGQHVAADLGERCTSAVLALSTAGGDPFFRALMHHLAHVARTDPAESPYATTLWAAGGDGFDTWARKLPERRPQPNEPDLEGLARRYEAAARHDAHHRLTNLCAPALILAAEDDLMLRPQLGERLAAGLPNAEFTVWDRATHLCINENPERFVDTCRDFLDA